MKQDRPLIVVTNQAHPDALAVLAGFARIDANPAEAPWPRAELLRRTASADGLLAFMTDHVDAEFLAHCPDLRAIGCGIIGHKGLRYLKGKGADQAAPTPSNTEKAPMRRHAATQPAGRHRGAFDPPTSVMSPWPAL